MRGRRGWRGFAAPSSLRLNGAPENRGARLHSRRDGKTESGRMRQNINYPRGGQIRVSKWARPEYRTQKYIIPATSGGSTVFLPTVE